MMKIAEVVGKLANKKEIYGIWEMIFKIDIFGCAFMRSLFFSEEVIVMKTKIILKIFVLGLFTFAGGTSVANATPGKVVNVDFQSGSNSYTGLGVLGSGSDTLWNPVGPNGSGGTNLLYADGSGTSGISVTATHTGTYANLAQPNPLVIDWIYTWNIQETITISGLAPNSTFDLSFYDGFYWADFTVLGQPGPIAEVRPMPTTSQCLDASTTNDCNGTMSDIVSDGSGNITIIADALSGGAYGVASTIAGMQILQTNIENTPLIFSNTYISTGASAEVYGDILANTYLVAGASTVVEGEIQTGAAVTTGATTDITGNIRAGAAITLGASTVVDGYVCSGAALTLGAGASYVGYDCSFDAMIYTNNDVIAAQDSYNALTAEYLIDRNQLNPTMSVDLTLDPDGDLATITDGTTVVYNTTSLTSAAGVTLTLDGNYDWVFNITDMLSFGAGTKIVMTGGSEGSVTWNVGGYASIGADAETVGTIFANGYISTGVRAKVRGAVSSSVSSEPSQSYCGGLFSATSYVTIGASSTVSCE
jgi:cytoskeletal protein CcmA (bactofilin family)